MRVQGWQVEDSNLFICRLYIERKNHCFEIVFKSLIFFCQFNFVRNTQNPYKMTFFRLICFIFIFRIERNCFCNKGSRSHLAFVFAGRIVLCYGSCSLLWIFHHTWKCESNLIHWVNLGLTIFVGLELIKRGTSVFCGIKLASAMCIRLLAILILPLETRIPTAEFIVAFSIRVLSHLWAFIRFQDRMKPSLVRRLFFVYSTTTIMLLCISEVQDRVCALLSWLSSLVALDLTSIKSSSHFCCVF